MNLLARFGLVLALLLSPAAQAAERVVTFQTGRGDGFFRVLLIAPEGPPRGALVLLGGGDGSLDLSEEGRIRGLAGNQLVRTRMGYAQAGWLVALPDLPLDIWRDRQRGRLSAEHAADLGQVIAMLRRETGWVALAGTSNGTLSASNAVARLAGDLAPDALVLTAGLLPANNGALNVEEHVPGIRQARQPMLLVHHVNDLCPATPPSGPERLRPLLAASRGVEVTMLEGGSATGLYCEAQSHHGFRGIDAEVVRVVSGWLARQR